MKAKIGDWKKKSEQTTTGAIKSDRVFALFVPTNSNFDFTITSGDSPVEARIHVVWTKDQKYPRYIASPQTFEHGAFDPFVERELWPRTYRILEGYKDVVVKSGKNYLNKYLVYVDRKNSVWTQLETYATEIPWIGGSLEGLKVKISRGGEKTSPKLGSWTPLLKLSKEDMVKLGYNLTSVPESELFEVLNEEELEKLAEQVLQEKLANKKVEEEKEEPPKQELKDEDIPF